MESRAKKARTRAGGLQDVIRLGGISNGALHKISDAAKRTPIVLEASRNELSAAFQERFLAIRAEIPCQLVGGSAFRWNIA